MKRASIFCACLIAITALTQPDRATDFFANPVLPHQLDDSERNIAGLRRELSYILSLSDEEILARMPVQVPRIHNGCPNCRKGKTKRHPRWDYEQPPSFGKLKGQRKVYDPITPDQYLCPDCNETYPNNPKYPQSEKATLLTQKGHEVTVRYHLDANGINYRNYNDDKPFPRRYYLDGVLDTERHAWIHRQMVNLAKLYHLTRDKKAGHRAMVILNAYADRWPTWLYNQHYGHGYAELRKDRLEGWGVMTREGRRTNDERNGPAGFMETTDLMIGTPAFKAFEQNLGINLKDKLWNNVIHLAIERGLKTKDYQEVMMSEFGQACPTGDYTQLARVFNRPELIRNTAIKGLDYTPRICMGIDGSFVQGTGYGQIHLGAMSKMREVNGYSDPLGFQVPQGQKAIQDYRYPYGPHETYWMKAYNYLARIRMPDGGVPITNDGEHRSYISWIPGYNVPLRESRNVIAHGYKYAILGDGRDDEQFQLHLNYSPNAVGHGHADALTPQLFAFGHYLMDDSEYCKTNIRNYSNATAGHNTVVINHANQGDASPLNYKRALPFQEGSPKFFEGRAPGIRLISVDAARAYQAHGVTRYQRTMLMNTYEPERPYVLDVFQIKGGKTRDYMLRASYQHDSTGKTSYAMTKMPGLTPLVPEHEKGKLNAKDLGSCYRLFFDVNKGSAETNGIVDYQVKKPWQPRRPGPHSNQRPDLAPYKANPDVFPDNPPVGTRHHIVGQPDQQAFFFGSPDTYEAIVHSKKSSSTTDYENWKRVPHFMLRHELEDPTQETMFVVVHEPWIRAPKIKTVTRVHTGNDNLLGLEISFGDRTDRIFYALNGKESAGKIRNVSFSGRVGIYAEKGKQRESFLFGGSELKKSWRKTKLSNKVAKVEGEIVRSYRKWNGDAFDGFRIQYTGPLPSKDDLSGSFATVQNTGPITNLEAKDFINPGLVPRHYHTMKRDLGDPYAQLEAIYKKKDKRQYARYEAAAELAKTIKATLRETNAGWGFAIDRVEQDGNTLIVYTEEDHGLEIHNGKTAEFAYPMREFETPNTLTILPMMSSQAAPTVTPPGGAFMNPVTVTLDSPAPNQDLFYAIQATDTAAEPVWMRYGKPVLPEALQPKRNTTQLNWLPYKKPITISRNTTLLVRAENPNGIRKQPPKAYHFAVAEPSVGDSTSVSPGLKRAIRRAYFDRKAGAPKRHQGKVQVQTIAERIKSGAIRYDDPMVEDVVTTVDATDVINRCIEKRMQAEMTLTGYLKVTDPGIYKIYYRPHHDGDLFINGKHYVRGRYTSATPMPYAFEIPLRTGLVPIKLIYRFIDNGMREGKPNLEFEWVKPNGTREFIPASALFHNE